MCNVFLAGAVLWQESLQYRVCEPGSVKREGAKQFYWL